MPIIGSLDTSRSKPAGSFSVRANLALYSAAVGVATEAGVVTKVVAAAWTLTNLLKKRYSSLTAGLENEKKIRLVAFM